MATGWVQVGNIWYYMNESGVMQVDTWIGNNYVDGSGAWIPGKAKNADRLGEKREPLVVQPFLMEAIQPMTGK